MVIATPNHTHVLISVTAAANGKHVYVENPISHNVWEGVQLAAAQKAFGVIVQHGFQRRSETAWENAFDYEKTPILFEVRGLPSRNMDYKTGMDSKRFKLPI